MVKALEKARKAARQAQEATYEGLCTVIECKSDTDDDTSLTNQSESIVLENLPCKLSFEKMEAASSKEMAAEVAQGAKLFLAPEIKVAEGSKVVVVQNGITSEYQASGPPAVYSTHQEIMLELWKEWA